MSPPTDSTKRGSTYVYNALVDAGVDLLIGLPGTQTLPLDRTVVEREEMQYVMARHETAIPHIAWGYFEAGGQPAATLTIPGPGDTNAIHGLKNAAEDNVPILHISADANPTHRGQGPIHELDPDTFDTVVKANINVETPHELPAAIARGIEQALTQPFGPVRLGIPSNLLAAEISAPSAEVTPPTTTYDNTNAIADAIDTLAKAEAPVIYAGGGARRSSEGPKVVQNLAAELDAPVVTSVKGKGVFPEDNPRWLGVTGSHLPTDAEDVLATADVVLALGTDFDGVTTDHWELPFGDTLIHVNLVTCDINAGYDADIAIVDDVTTAGRKLLTGLQSTDSPSDRWDGETVATRVRETYMTHLENEGLSDETTPAHTPAVLTAVREETPRNAIITTDVGGFRLWSLQLFETYSPEQCITAGSWAGMGVGLPAAIGAQLAAPDTPVVCLSGDGGLMMCLQEMHTAAAENLDITVVVSNNRDYGVISKSPKIETYTDGHQFTWTSPSFVSIAEGFGWEAERVTTPSAAGTAVADAMETNGPTLIDVAIQQDEPSAVAVSDYPSSEAEEHG